MFLQVFAQQVGLSDAPARSLQARLSELFRTSEPHFKDFLWVFDLISFNLGCRSHPLAFSQLLLRLQHGQLVSGPTASATTRWRVSEY